MLGFTGTWRGKRVSVQGSGMGQPSLAIYANELVSMYGAKRLVRIGSCGSIQPHVRLRDLIVVMSASTDSSMNRLRFGGMDYAPTASFPLFQKAIAAAQQLAFPFHAGDILSSDSFYMDEPDAWRRWADYGVLAIEMESSALYTIAAKLKVEALTLLTVSDSLVTGEATSSEERQSGFRRMTELALALLE